MALSTSFALSLLVLAQPQSAVIPRTDAETATGRKLKLPDSLVGPASILVVGFSKSSANTTEWWETSLLRDVAGPQKTPILRVAHLEAIPGILRGLLLGKIKSNVQKERRNSFLMLFEQQDAWKKAVDFNAPDDAYVVVVDPSGKVLWRAHGGVDAAQYAVAVSQLKAILAAK